MPYEKAKDKWIDLELENERLLEEIVELRDKVIEQRTRVWNWMIDVESKSPKGIKFDVRKEDDLFSSLINEIDEKNTSMKKNKDEMDWLEEYMKDPNGYSYPDTGNPCARA